MKNFILILSILCFSIASGQVPEKPKTLKGIGINLTAKGGYYPQFFIRPFPYLEIQAIGTYSYHTPTVSHFTKTTVQGWFMGAGLSVLTRPLRSKTLDPNKKVKGSLRIGLKFMGGRMQYQAYKRFEGNYFDPYVLTDNQKNLKTNYGEISLGYELAIKNRIKVDLIPIILGDSGVYSSTGFTLPYSTIGGHTGFPLAAGIGLSYLWR
jgi:hypothetical protein